MSNFSELRLNQTLLSDLDYLAVQSAAIRPPQ